MTKSERLENSIIVANGCIVCRNAYGVRTPAEIHHVRRLGTKRGNSPKIGLCPAHHRGQYGEAVHAGREEWEKRHGEESALVAQTEEMLLRYSVAPTWVSK